MNTSVINIKIDPQVKKAAQKTAADLGLSLSSVINGYLREFIVKKSMTFSDIRLEPTPHLEAILRKSQKDIKEGNVKSFDNPSSALSYIDTIIADGKKYRLHRIDARVRKTTS